MLEFSSLNPYASLQVVIADDPQALVNELKTIRTPIKIISITTYGARQAAYFVGDAKITQQKRKGRIKDGSNSSS
jgi:hypothetical protein